LIASLKDITIPELLDALGEAWSGKLVDIYKAIDPTLIDKLTDALADFRDAVKKKF